MPRRVNLRPAVFLAILMWGIALQAPGSKAANQATSQEAQELGQDAAPVKASKVQPNAKLKAYDPNGGAGRNIHVVPIEGTIDLGLASFVDRVLKSAKPNDIILLQVKTFGGRVDAAVKIRDALLETDVTTVAFVRRAISAGALISLAADTIIMSPGGSIGAATPVQQGQGGEMQPTSEKVVSYMRAEMGATADAKGRPRKIAEAMVDGDIEIKDVVEKGKVLTLTSDRAVDLGIAEGEAPSLPDALALLNLSEAKRVEQKTHWAEALARFLTDPVVSSLLMTLGFLGLMSELVSPGFGIGGIIGIICLGLFFTGQYAADLAGAEEIILFVLGFALLALEIFVIPGFGAAGIAGIVCIGIALGMAMVELELPLDISFELGYLQPALAAAVIRLAIVTVVIVAASAAMFRYLPSARSTGWLVFQAKPQEATGTVGLGAEARGSSLTKRFDHLRGKEGVAESVLRPSGMALIDGERVDVLADGQFIEPGTKIRVLLVEGTRVVVRAVEAPTEEDAHV